MPSCSCGGLWPKKAWAFLTSRRRLNPNEIGVDKVPTGKAVLCHWCSLAVVFGVFILIHQINTWCWVEHNLYPTKSNLKQDEHGKLTLTDGHSGLTAGACLPGFMEVTYETDAVFFAQGSWDLYNCEQMETRPLDDIRYSFLGNQTFCFLTYGGQQFQLQTAGVGPSTTHELNIQSAEYGVNVEAYFNRGFVGEAGLAQTIRIVYERSCSISPLYTYTTFVGSTVQYGTNWQDASCQRTQIGSLWSHPFKSAVFRGKVTKVVFQEVLCAETKCNTEVQRLYQSVGFASPLLFLLYAFNRYLFGRTISDRSRRVSLSSNSALDEPFLGWQETRGNETPLTSNIAMTVGTR